jgi:hypothetical protein
VGNTPPSIEWHHWKLVKKDRGAVKDRVKDMDDLPPPL